MIIGALIGAGPMSSSPLALSVDPISFSEVVTTNTGTTSGVATAVISGGVAPYTVFWQRTSGVGISAASAHSTSTAFTWTAISVGASRAIEFTATVTDAVLNTADFIFVASIERI